METLTGLDAIEYAEQHGLKLSKHADPTQGACEGLTVDEAREVARQDPALVYLRCGYFKAVQTESGVVLWRGVAMSADDALERMARAAGYPDYASAPGGDGVVVREVPPEDVAGDPEELQAQLESELARLGYEEMSVEPLSDGLVRLADSESWVARGVEALRALRGARVVPAPKGSLGEGREGHEAVWEALQRVDEVALCDHCGEESGELADGAVDTEQGQRVGRQCQALHVAEDAAAGSGGEGQGGHEPTLNEVLASMGLSTRPAQRGLYAQEVLDAAGVALFTGLAGEVWHWLRETGKLPK